MNRIESPYTASGTWIQGNLHTHTTVSDGPCDVARTIEGHAALGHDFLAVSDHDVLVDTTSAQSIRFVTDHGVVQRTAPGPTATVRLPDHLVYGSDHSYLGIECVGEHGAMAWSQPLFLE